MFYEMHYHFFGILIMTGCFLHEYIKDTFTLSKIRIQSLVSLCKLIFIFKQTKAVSQETWPIVR